jgi:hypothetical protein
MARDVHSIPEEVQRKLGGPFTNIVRTIEETRVFLASLQPRRTGSDKRDAFLVQGESRELLTDVRGPARLLEFYLASAAASNAWAVDIEVDGDLLLRGGNEDTTWTFFNGLDGMEQIDASGTYFMRMRNILAQDRVRVWVRATTATDINFTDYVALWETIAPADRVQAGAPSATPRSR